MSKGAFRLLNDIIGLIAQYLDSIGYINSNCDITFTGDLLIGSYSVLTGDLLIGSYLVGGVGRNRWIDIHTKNGLFEIKLDLLVEIMVSKLHYDTYSILLSKHLSIGDPNFFLKLNQYIGLK